MSSAEPFGAQLEDIEQAVVTFRRYQTAHGFNPGQQQLYHNLYQKQSGVQQQQQAGVIQQQQHITLTCPKQPQQQQTFRRGQQQQQHTFIDSTPSFQSSQSFSGLQSLQVQPPPLLQSNSFSVQRSISSSPLGTDLFKDMESSASSASSSGSASSSNLFKTSHLPLFAHLASPASATASPPFLAADTDQLRLNMDQASQQKGQAIYNRNIWGSDMSVWG